MPTRACNVCGRPSTGPRCALHPVKRQQRPERGQAAYRTTRLAVLERDDYRCHWCSRTANEVDHYPIAYIDGGPSTPDNLVAACRSCNASRGASSSAPRHLRAVS